MVTEIQEIGRNFLRSNYENYRLMVWYKKWGLDYMLFSLAGAGNE